MRDLEGQLGDRDERSGAIGLGPSMVLLYRNTHCGRVAELPQGDVRATE
jgi:hypothetical protein